MADRTPPLKLAIAGLGAIGLPWRAASMPATCPASRSSPLSVRDEAKARRTMAGFRAPPLAGLCRRWQTRPT